MQFCVRFVLREWGRQQTFISLSHIIALLHVGPINVVYLTARAFIWS